MTVTVVLEQQQLAALKDAVVDSLIYNGTWADRLGKVDATKELAQEHQAKAVEAGKLLTLLCKFAVEAERWMDGQQFTDVEDIPF